MTRYVMMICTLIDAIQQKRQPCFWYNYAVVGSNEEIFILFLKRV